MLLLLLNTLNDDERTKCEELYNQYKNLMMYIALKVLKNQSLAEEAVHDTMIAILKVINDIEEVKCHKTYGLVVLISKRCSLNKLKYEKRRNHSTEEVIEYMVSDTKSIDDIVIDKIGFEEVQEEMKTVSETDYEIIILKYYYGYTYKEIAARIDIKEATARKRCERAKRHILNKIEGKGVGNEKKQKRKNR